MRKTTFSIFQILAILGAMAAAPAVAANITGQVSQPGEAVVFLDKVTGAFSAGENGGIDQQSLKFAPKILVVLRGATVEFKNSDSIRHNVFGVGAEQFDLGTWTKGVTKSHTFSKVGYTALLCNVHPEMEAHVLVLQNPYHARPDSSGKFTIEDVPAGKYNLIVWRPNKKAKKKPITVNGESVDIAVD